MSIRPRKSSTYYDPEINRRISTFLNAHCDYPVPHGHLLTMYVDLEQPDARPGAVEPAILSKEQRDHLATTTLDGGFGLYIVVRRRGEVLHERLATLISNPHLDKESGNMMVHIEPKLPRIEQQSRAVNQLDGTTTDEPQLRFAPKPKIFDFETIGSKEHVADERPSSRLPRPCLWLALANRLHPKLWRFVDASRSKSDRSYPKSIFVDRGTVAKFLEPDIKTHLMRAQRQAMSKAELHVCFQEVAILCALSSWRPTQGIYRFDPEIYEELIRTPLTGDLPFEILYRLPEWCVYVETPYIEHYYGFYACLDYHAYQGENEIGLFLVFDRSDGLYADVLPFSKAPLSTIIEKSCTQDGIVHGVGLVEKKEVYQCTIALLLYLCASNAEIGRTPKRPTLPSPKKTKDGWRLFPPDKPMIWDVGFRIGAALRRAKEQATQVPDEARTFSRSGKRPHIRRAHWHAFWHGSRAEAETRVLKLRWLHPVAVKVESVEDLPAVVRPVKES